MGKMKKRLAIIMSMLMVVQTPVMAGELLVEEAPVQEEIVRKDIFNKEEVPEDISVGEEAVIAEDEPALVGATSDQCGDNVYWSLSDDGVLTISGTGDMWEWEACPPPWDEHSNEISNVIIESGVTSMGSDAFAYCDSLTEISVHADNSEYSSVDGALFNKDQSTIICYPRGKVGTYAILDSVTSIGDFAFYGCDSLTSVTLPDSVTSIGGSAFARCSSLTSVTIPDSVTSIGRGAFSQCASLTEILVRPNNSKYSSLEGILFNKDQSTIICYPEGKAGAYVIPDRVTSIGDNAFWDCSALTSVTIGNSVTSIGDWAFAGCTSLTSVTIPDSVKSIEFGAFDDCTSLASVTIGDGVTNIGGQAFCGCNALTSVTIGNSVTIIEYGAFYACISLTSVTIPDSVTIIADVAFYHCTSLESVSIPASVTSIGEGAFEFCSALTSIYFEGDSPVFSSDVFGSVTATAYYPAHNPTWTEGVMQDYGGNITWVPYDPEIELSTYNLTLREGEEETIAVTINNGDQLVSWESGDTSIATVDNGLVTGVSAGKTVITITFASGKMLTVNVIVNAGITQIEPNTTTAAVISESGDMAYFSFIPEETNTYVFYSMSEEDTYGYLYDADMNQITSDDDGGDGNNFRITYILSAGEQYYFGARFYSDSAGSFDVRLEAEPVVTNGQCGDDVYWSYEEGTLTISGTGDMYDYSDHSCVPWGSLRSIITSIIIESKVTSIGDYSFSECITLTNVTIPDSVTSIGDSAFSYCDSLTGLTIPDSVTSIGDSAFFYCITLSSMTIPDSVTSIGDSAFSGCYVLTSVTIPDSVTSIGESAFSYCTSLTSVTIPDGVTSIGYGTFDTCTSLTSVMIGDSMMSIGDFAFIHCDALMRILVSDNNSTYSSLDGVLFSKDQSMLILYPYGRSGSYAVPDSVTTIGKYAFARCSALTSVKIPDSVTSIGDSAFFECSALTSVTIGNGVTNIGDEAFCVCDSLSSVTIPDSVTSIGDSAFSGCSSLSNIYFHGDNPEVGHAIFGDVTATAYYPASNPTWTEDVMQNYYGNITWVPWNPSPEVRLYEDTLKLPNSTTSIESESFAGLTQGVNIDVPDSVTSIADDAFEGSAVVIIGAAGGYVEEFCNEHEIPFSAR